MRGVVTVSLSAALPQITPRAAMTTASPVERETVALSLEAVLTVALVRRRRCDLRRRRAAGDKRRQALDVAVVILSVLRMTTAKARLFAKLLTRLEELRIARQIGLRIPR